MRDETSLLGKWAILIEWVPQLRAHIEARADRRGGVGGLLAGGLPAGGLPAGGLRPTWTDLMLWSVLTREAALVKPLWACTTEPLRAALLASRACQRLRALPHLRSEHGALRAAADEYEGWALALLECIDASEAAYPILAMVPCVDVGRRLWEGSALDDAAEE